MLIWRGRGLHIQAITHLFLLINIKSIFCSYPESYPVCKQARKILRLVFQALPRKFRLRCLKKENRPEKTTPSVSLPRVGSSRVIVAHTSVRTCLVEAHARVLFGKCHLALAPSFARTRVHVRKFRPAFPRNAFAPPKNHPKIIPKLRVNLPYRSST